MMKKPINRMAIKYRKSKKYEDVGIWQVREDIVLTLSPTQKELVCKKHELLFLKEIIDEKYRFITEKERFIWIKREFINKYAIRIF